jgi:hypothetical protein
LRVTLHFSLQVVHPPRALTETPLMLLKTRHLIRPTKADGEDLETNELLAKEPHPSSPRQRIRRQPEE